MIPLVLFLLLLREVDKREPRLRKTNAKIRKFVKADAVKKGVIR